jgi:hypothetical protein
VQHENFELKFRYSFLAPPVDSTAFDETDAEGIKPILFYNINREIFCPFQSRVDDNFFQYDLIKDKKN